MDTEELSRPKVSPPVPVADTSSHHQRNLKLRWFQLEGLIGVCNGDNLTSLVLIPCFQYMVSCHGDEITPPSELIKNILICSRPAGLFILKPKQLLMEMALLFTSRGLTRLWNQLQLRHHVRGKQLPVSGCVSD